MHIRDKLLEEVSEISAVFIGAFPFESLEDGPVAVLMKLPSSANRWKGWREEVSLELLIKRSSNEAEELELLEGRVTSALNQALLESEYGIWVTLPQGSEHEDRLDHDLDARIRTLHFSALSPRPLAATGGIDEDPWLHTLIQWSSELLGAEWSIYGGNWPAKPERPCLMWRMTGMNVTAAGPTGYRCDKQFEAFIQANQSGQSNEALLKLLDKLGSSAKLPLQADSREYAKVSGLHVDLSSANDGYALSDQGVLGVTLSRIVSAMSSETGAALMRQVHYVTNNK